MQAPTRKLEDINRLLACYPPGNWADPEQALRGYLLAVDDYPAGDVELAVTALTKGTAPGVNPGFLPPPAVVGAECRRQMNLRLDREALDKRLHPSLPPPDIVKSPESRARVAELVKRTVAGLKGPDEEDPAERHRRRIAKTNERFDRDAYFEVGDPEDHDAAARGKTKHERERRERQQRSTAKRGDKGRLAAEHGAGCR